jgi:UDP-N-acetylglucosamine:LPS N-acetylglucosamine transferase
MLTISPESRAPRVAVITGSYGAGHNCAANELSRVLRAAGCEVDVHDIVSLLPARLGPALRAIYYLQLRRRPESWGTTLRLLEPGRRLHKMAKQLLRIAVPPIVEAVAGCDLVMTTHPFGVQALGQARSAGLLPVPAVTYLTDASVHSLWIHPGIDLSLAIHQVAAQEAASWGGPAAVVRPLVGPVVVGVSAAEVDDPLSAHGIQGPRALVTGGSLGTGDLERTAQDILAAGEMTPVVLCGTDGRLRRRLSRLPGVVALGWREDVYALMATSSCVVQNAGGFTSLEALASGTPVITYRPIPGHGIANAANLEAAGLVPWARRVDDLALLLSAARSAPRVDRLPADAPGVVALLTGHRQLAVAA